MPKRRVHLALLVAMLLGTAPAFAVTTEIDAATRAYIQGRLALSADDYPAARRYFSEALKGSEDDTALRGSFETAMLAGDLKEVVRLANRIGQDAEKSDTQQSLDNSILSLVKAASAAARRDWRTYDSATAEFIARDRRAVSEQVLGRSMEAWGKAARGDFEAALTIADPSKASGILASYLREQRANILALAGRWSEAASLYGALASGEGANVARLRLSAAASLLESAPGDVTAREKAMLLVGDRPAEDPLLVDARARMLADPRISGRKLGETALVLSPQQGLALLFVRFAADLGRAGATGPAINFGRLATLADPGLADGWLIVADSLARARKYDAALVALDGVSKNRPWRELADVRRAGILLASGKTDAARAILSARAAAANATAVDWEQLADLERRSERPQEAVAAYGRALALVPDNLTPLVAHLHFLRGSVLEASGNWPEAEPDLRKAVELVDNNPIYLNYLGYSLLDRNRDLEEAHQLIARAFALAPESGAIMDSMGWAEHKIGNHAQAVSLLEQARSAEPSDPTVADHLGDTLWAMGRRIEARHAWAAAAALEPEPELAARIQRKLEFGLDIAGNHR